jgi:hypothetical protein
VSLKAKGVVKINTLFYMHHNWSSKEKMKEKVGAILLKRRKIKKEI